MSADNQFTVLAVGWEPSFIELVGEPISKANEFNFVYGIVGNSKRLHYINKQYPDLNLVALSKSNNESLPKPDFELLASLECKGVPTVRAMVQGDRVLRDRPDEISFGYATLLAQKLIRILEEIKPKLVIASFDNLHSTISLAVSKKLSIPWVTMAFTAIPNDLTSFCKGVTQNSLLPINRPVDDELIQKAKHVIREVREERYKVVAHRPAVSLGQYLHQFVSYGSNFLKRLLSSEELGCDIYTWPTTRERVADILRRTRNKLLLPSNYMIKAPPDGEYAYFPLHRVPESTIDTCAPFFQNQIALIQQLALALPADMKFVVKLHFSDPDNFSRRELIELMGIPGLMLAHHSASGQEFLRGSSLVIGIHGTACIEAAILGKPVIVLADSPYKDFPLSIEAGRPDKIYEQICELLSRPEIEGDTLAESLAAYMARYLPGRINDWTRPIEKDEMERLADCFTQLRMYLEEPNNVKNWYCTEPFVSD